jgi:uncharacterized Zn finger protein
MKITETGNNRWSVESDSGKVYEVRLRTRLDEMGSMFFTWECNCPSRQHPCKHCRAVGAEYPPYDDEAGERTN